jgi:hypothetical protein
VVFTLYAVLFEDSKENIMIESLKLFEEVVQNPLFRTTPIFLFLNKKDLFEEVIKTVPLTKCFPNYSGPANDMNPALRYIEDQFRGIVEKHTPGKGLPIHVVAARVRRDMKLAFGEVKDTLKRSFLQQQNNGNGSNSVYQSMNWTRKQSMLQPASPVKR